MRNPLPLNTSSIHEHMNTEIRDPIMRQVRDFDPQRRTGPPVYTAIMRNTYQPVDDQVWVNVQEHIFEDET